MHDLIIKYLNDQCTNEEIDRVLYYLQTPGGQQLLASIMKEEELELREGQMLEQEPDYNQILSRIRTTIHEDSPAGLKVVPFHRRWYSVAAAITVLFVAAWWLYTPPTQYAHYQTAYGQTKVIALSDGSSVTLNANSSLKISTDQHIREAWLQGEAYFDIAEVMLNEEGPDNNELKKFVVHTQKLDVVVVGTSFNVQDRDNKTQVVLNSGKIWLESASADKLVLEPGELAELTYEGQVMKTSVNDPAIYSAWKENKLICRNTTLEEIAQVIHHRFGYSSVFEAEDVRTLAITGTLPLHQLSLLTETLQESLNISIQISDQTLIIQEKK